jgi:hypothetical protein
MLSPQQSLPSSAQPLSSRPDNGLTQRAIAVEALRFQQFTTLSFQELSAFERVREQYAHLGVRFEGAIALEPSNPLFHPDSGALILMPVNDQAGITVVFDRPTEWIGAFVTSVRPVLMTAFDENGNSIEQASTDWDQVYTEEGSLRFPLPQQRLELQAKNIARVIFHSYAPFTLANFYCGNGIAF